MMEYVHDQDGDRMRIESLGQQGPISLNITELSGDGDPNYSATLGPVDPQAVIAAIRVAAGLFEPETTVQHFPNGSKKVTTLHADGTSEDRWETPQELSFEEATEESPYWWSAPAVFAVCVEDQQQERRLWWRDETDSWRSVDGELSTATKNLIDVTPLRTSAEGRDTARPATAEELRVWAGADEPIIDQLIGRVADLEEEKERTEAHQHLAQHWERRLDVARQALAMTPRRGESKPTGALSGMFGYEKSGQVSVTDALKIARFAADEDREIPGVDK